MNTDDDARIASLTVALDAKRRDHAATLVCLARAYEVIDRQRAAYERVFRVLWLSRRTWQRRGSERGV